MRYGMALKDGYYALVRVCCSPLGLVLSVAACGMNVQTNRPYTPSDGVAVDVGDPANPNKVVHVRNLSIISWAPGEGVVSGSIVTADRDSLTAVSGTPIKAGWVRGYSVHRDDSVDRRGSEWPPGRAD